MCIILGKPFCARWWRMKSTHTPRVVGVPHRVVGVPHPPARNTHRDASLHQPTGENRRNPESAEPSGPGVQPVPKGSQAPGLLLPRLFGRFGRQRARKTNGRGGATAEGNAGPLPHSSAPPRTPNPSTVGRANGVPKMAPKCCGVWDPVAQGSSTMGSLLPGWGCVVGGWE